MAKGKKLGDVTILNTKVRPETKEMIDALASVKAFTDEDGASGQRVIIEAGLQALKESNPEAWEKAEKYLAIMKGL